MIYRAILKVNNEATDTDTSGSSTFETWICLI